MPANRLRRLNPEAGEYFIIFMAPGKDRRPPGMARQQVGQLKTHNIPVKSRYMPHDSISPFIRAEGSHPSCGTLERSIALEHTLQI